MLFSNIDQVTGTTITLFVGKANDNTAGAHTFVSATAGAVTSGGNYTHTFVSAVANGVFSEQDKIVLESFDYYFSNVIARAAKTMMKCRSEKQKIKSTGTDG